MLKEFQIFKAGKYGESESRVWTDDEVKQIIDNYDYNFRRAMIKLGHDGILDGEKPAVGWVEDVYLKNGVLYAKGNFNNDDIKNIKDKYINVSIEVTKSIQSYDLDTDKQGAYLLGVALLGSSQPAVAGLEPLKFSKDSAVEMIGNITIDKNEFQKKINFDNITPNNEKDKKMEKQLEEFKTQNEKLLAELEEFKKLDKKNQIKNFFSKNEKKIVPAVKDEMLQFSLDLNDEQLEKFKSIVEKMPEISVFNNDLENTEEPQNNLEIDPTKEALKDLEAYKAQN